MTGAVRRLVRRFPVTLRVAIGAVRAVALVLALIEVPLFYIRHRRLFANRLGCTFWVWSFGHQILGLDYIARMHHPHRISLVVLPDPRVNPYLPLCYENFDVFEFRSMLTPLLERLDRRLNFFPVRQAQHAVLRFGLLLASACSGRFAAIDRVATVYTTLSTTSDGMWIGNEAAGVLSRTDDITGYGRLVRDGVGRPPRMPEALRARCVAAISRRHPRFFDRPFVAMLLRRKGWNSPDFSDSIRCAGPPANYEPAVRYLASRGYHIVATAETATHAPFAQIDGFYDLSDVDLPSALLNLFVLMHCAVYIGQASGPNWMGGTVGYPTLVCDGVWYSGTWRPSDLILYKPLYETDTGRRLPIVEVFRSHLDLVFGYNYGRKRITVGYSSPDEILEGVKETLAALEGPVELDPADARLCARYRDLLPDRAIIHAQKNRPPLYVLRQHEKDLLEDGELLRGGAYVPQSDKDPRESA